MQPPRFYGRRAGRRLSPLLQAALAEAGDQYALTLPETGEEGALDLAAVFGRPYSRYALEIGFGMGEHLLDRALAEPETGFIGAEPFRNGVAKLVAGLDACGAGNVRIWNDDVRLLLPLLPMGGFAAIYVLFPDPWPKRRHQARRLIQPPLLATLRHLLVPDGELVLASDDPGYQVAMLRHLLDCPGLLWTAERAADWQALPGFSGKTGYQRRADAAGRMPIFLRASAKALG
jgi:tRNA (guanine-N7-)-methyltransferase